MATRKKTTEPLIEDQLSDLGADSGVKSEKLQAKQAKAGSQVRQSGKSQNSDYSAIQQFI